MINYEKFLLFCEQWNMSFEETMLLYTLHVRNENKSPHLHKIMESYYEHPYANWTRTILSLQEREYLIVLKGPDKYGKFLLKDLAITEKFENLLFIDPDKMWSEFVRRYPKEGLNPQNTGLFPANKVTTGDKEYFIKYILKGCDAHEAKKILFYMEDMFDWDGTEATTYASLGITRFMLNWDSFIKEHNEKIEREDVSWKRRL